VQFHFEPHQVSEAVDRAVKNAQAALRLHPLEINLPHDLPPVRMDLERITEVIVHLLDNASKYSPPETAIHVTAEVRGAEVILSVADHGPGIEEIEQSMIFEKFYRGLNQRRTVQGTGMGLAIVKAIVDLHGGKLGVTSQLRRGSVFFFSLPIA
jgi:two-component system sensor histidine kinase KdpD